MSIDRRFSLLGCMCALLALTSCSSNKVWSAKSADASVRADGATLDGATPDGATVDGAATGASKDGGKAGGIETLANGLPACGRDELTALPRIANVLLVIDESGSMTDTPKGFSTSKWLALKTALKQTLAAIPDNLTVGLELFPHAAGSSPIPLACTDNCCEMPAAPGITVPIAAASTAVAAIEKALDASSPAGGTPTELALARAYDYFTSGAGKGLKGDKYVLLATDGGPNCNTALSCTAASCTTNLDGECTIPNGNCCDPMFGGNTAKARCLDDTATLAQITKLATQHIQTFVVGIPGSEMYASSLDEFAVAGGKPNPAAPPKYYAVSAAGGASGLTATLDLITKNVITSCVLQLGSVPPNLDQLNVYVDSKLIKQAGADGWTLDRTDSPPTIVLQGATCKTVETQGAKSVRVLYGCPTVE